MRWTCRLAPWAWIATALSGIGCSKILGADFDGHVPQDAGAGGVDASAGGTAGSDGGSGGVEGAGAGAGGGLTGGTAGAGGLAGGPGGTTGTGGSAGTPSAGGAGGVPGAGGTANGGGAGTAGVSGMPGTGGSGGTAGTGGSSGNSGTAGAGGSAGDSGTAGTAGSGGQPAVRLSVTADLLAEFWADRGVSVSGGVDRWANPWSGGDLTQPAVARRPQYNATDSDFGAVNASVQFPGLVQNGPYLDGLEQAGAELAGFDKPATLAVAVKRTGATNFRTYFVLAEGTINARAHMQLRGGENSTSFVLTKGGSWGITQIFNVGTDDGSTTILVWRFDGSNSYLLQDGMPVAGAYGVPHATGNTALSRAVLGGRPNNEEQAAFKIGHLSLYGTDIGETDALTVSADINAVIQAY